MVHSAVRWSRRSDENQLLVWEINLPVWMGVNNLPPRMPLPPPIGFRARFRYQFHVRPSVLITDNYLFRRAKNNS